MKCKFFVQDIKGTEKMKAENARNVQVAILIPKILKIEDCIKGTMKISKVPS